MIAIIKDLVNSSNSRVASDSFKKAYQILNNDFFIVINKLLSWNWEYVLHITDLNQLSIDTESGQLLKYFSTLFDNCKAINEVFYLDKEKKIVTYHKSISEESKNEIVDYINKNWKKPRISFTHK